MATADDDDDEEEWPPVDMTDDDEDMIAKQCVLLRCSSMTVFYRSARPVFFFGELRSEPPNLFRIS